MEPRTENLPPPANENVRPALLDTLRPAPALPQVPAAATQRWQGLAPHRLKRVLSCIEMRLSEPIQVCELAEEVHMSPFHFTRMFKLATGHSPHKYITLQRIERAKQLLAASDMPIAAVAASVGYQTQAHFTGVFSRHAGTTPKVYRMAQRRAMASAAPEEASRAAAG